jgi:FlaA1/EpsC-like NDP-sugar epimerase
MTKSFLNFILRSRFVNQKLILGADVLLSGVVTWLTYLLSNNLFSYHLAFGSFWIFLVLSMVCSLVFFLLFRTYKGIIRHSSLAESLRILSACLLSALATAGLVRFVFVDELPTSLWVFNTLLDFLFTFALLVLVRVLLLLLYQHSFQTQGVDTRRRLLIYIDSEKEPVTPSSFSSLVGDNLLLGYVRFGSRDTQRIGGLKLYSIENERDFRKLLHHTQANALLFQNRKDVEAEQERLIRYGEKAKVSLLLLPETEEIRDGKVRPPRLAEVRIEDLLGRDEIKINMENIQKELQGKTVLVTGAAGSIGSEICRQLCTFGLKELVLFDMAETPMHNIRLELEDTYPDVKFTPIIGDIRVVSRLQWLMRTYKPQVVFHAAAYKHVPLMEENPCEAVLANVIGTRNLADLAVEYGVERFVMISTDKAVNPTNVMGASKRLAEIYVQTLSLAIARGDIQGKTKFITTRFGNVLGSNGSVIPRFREQLLKGGPLTVTHPEIIRYFMTIPEAVRLVLEAGVMGEGNEIFVFDMGKPVKIADLARRMIELAGLVPDQDIKIEYTGLRPGEKLYEELLATKENTLPTPNEKIFRAHVRDYEREEVVKAIDHLKEIAQTVDRMETVRCMKQIVSEFKSKNSDFEKLDK